MILFAPLLAGVFQYAAMRFIFSLGIGYISYAALSTVGNLIIGQLNAATGSLTGAAGQIAHMAGFGSAISILISAYTVRIALKAVTKIGVLPR
ncbi:MAG: DUF2523 domain-containing protein [Bacteroidales bacterium]|nr:DUF2523 domain-containing protein [Bacteroidales bacterium]